MFLRKISCTQCAHRDECPQRTRMLVNYCGSQRDSMHELIRLAAAECKTRHGQLFLRTAITPVVPATIYAMAPVATN